MVAPFEPPVFDSLSYVPEQCHARRTRTGPAEPSSYSGFGKTSLIFCLTALLLLAQILHGITKVYTYLKSPSDMFAIYVNLI